MARTLTSVRGIALRGTLGVLWMALAGSWAPAAWAGGFGEVEAQMEFDDNLPRAVRDQDTESDLALRVRPRGGWDWRPGDLNRLSLTGELDLRQQADLDGLSRAVPGVRIAWRRQTRLGGDAPWIELSALGRYEAWDSDVRTGPSYGAGLAFGLTPRPVWSLRLEAGYDRWDAEAEAFQQEGVSARFHNNLFLSSADILFVAYVFRSGDITSSAIPPDVDPWSQVLLDEATAIVADDAFPGRVAYRLDADAHAVTAGWSRTVGRKGAVEVALEAIRIHASGGLDYDVLRAWAGYRTRF